MLFEVYRLEKLTFICLSRISGGISLICVPIPLTASTISKAMNTYELTCLSALAAGLFGLGAWTYQSDDHHPVICFDLAHELDASVHPRNNE